MYVGRRDVVDAGGYEFYEAVDEPRCELKDPIEYPKVRELEGECASE